MSRWPDGLRLLVVVAVACSGKQPPTGVSTPPPARAPAAAEPATCRAPARPAASVEPTWVFRNLRVRAPVGMVQAPRRSGEPSGRWFLLDQYGVVHSFFENGAGEAVDARATDLSDRVYVNERWLGEVGLLGIALHPRFPSDPRVFLSYTARTHELVLRISSFRVREHVIDPASEVVLLEVPQPFENHNGGHLAFGPDGYLYIGTGDGGAAGDPFGHGQNKDTLLGAMLRIDVDRKEGKLAYGIVSDNPFVAGGGRAEIFAFGLRNPWRFSFDRETGELWAGDVGQDRWEEINLIVRGGNYGWNLREGRECFAPERPGCRAPGFEEPYFVVEHPLQAPRSISTGFVYRGARLPELVGRLVFGDYETGTVSALSLAADAGARSARELFGGVQASAFAEDEAGEQYVLDYGGNRVLRLDPSRGNDGLPRLLSETGCVEPSNPRALVSGAIPYDVAVPFWSDGAEKQRYLFLPRGTGLEVLPEGDLEVPYGTVLVKNFAHQGRLFETRFYVRHEDGEYSGYSYAWRSDGSDADLVESTRRGKVGGPTGALEWIFPGPEACHQCHTAAAGRTLGLELAQLNLPGQLERLAGLGVLESPVAGAPTLSTAEGSLEARARAYLHVNCSGCHRPQGPGRGALDLRYQVPLARSGVCEPSRLAVNRNPLVAPGHAEASPLFQRLSQRGEGSMPPLATLHVDREGAAVVAAWINAIGDCARE